MKIRAGIVGGAGYTAGELLRILIYHPNVEISFVHSNSHAGHKISDVHHDLLGDTELTFTNIIDEKTDVLFLCVGHAKSLEFLTNNIIPPSVKIIDLSQDFRLHGTFNQNNSTRNFIYGLPELNREAIKTASNIANPGCFATAFELALLPLAANGLIKDDVHINGITGSTGAGQALSNTTHFSWRTNNVSIYKAFSHQHLKEVKLVLETAAGMTIPNLNFIPLRGNFSRGIFLSAYTECSLSDTEATALYNNFYRDAAFTFVTDNEISLKDVVGTNKCLIRVEKYDNKILITSIIDNLTKGASGQAIQNMNLMFGFDERTGLNLRPLGF